MPPRSAKGEYIETETGNKISRRSQILGSQHITLGGKSIIQADACLRGDLHRLPPLKYAPSTPKDVQSTATDKDTPLTAIIIGRYVFVSPHALLQPPFRLSHGQHTYYPLRIADHVFIGPHCVISAASIGSYVNIEANAIVGNLCIVKDFVKILEGAVLPDGMVVPSFSVVGGRPAQIVGEVGEGWGLYEGTEGGSGRERYRNVR